MLFANMNNNVKYMHMYDTVIIISAQLITWNIIDFYARFIVTWVHLFVRLLLYYDLLTFVTFLLIIIK